MKIEIFTNNFPKQELTRMHEKAAPHRVLWVDLSIPRGYLQGNRVEEDH